MNPCLEDSRCSGCGACLEVCPTWKATHREIYGPRGRLALVRALCNDELKDPGDSLYSCLGCGLCDGACPARIPLTSIFFLAAQPKPALRRPDSFFLHLLAKPWLRHGAKYPALLLEKALPYLGATKSLPPLPIGEGNLPRESGPSGGKKILFYPGCLTAGFLPEVLRACLSALAETGCLALAPRNIPCCGRPHLMARRAKTARDLCLKNLALMENQEFDLLLTPCPACLDTIKKIWPSLPGLSASQKNALEILGRKALDINEFLATNGLMAPKSDAGWKRPCLMGQEAARAAKKLAGIDETERSAGGCCGASLYLTRREMASMIGQASRNGIRATGVQKLVTSCPGCILHLRTIFSENVDRIEILHSVQAWRKPT